MLKPVTEHSADEIPVTGFRLITTKHKKGGLRNTYYHLAELTTACGQKAGVQITADRVKDMPAAIARYEKNVSDRCVFLNGEMVICKMQFGM